MKSPRLLLIIAVMISCWLSLGCGLTLGPTVETRYVVIHPGRPLEVLENQTIDGRVLDGSGEAVKQDIGGWVAMPADHWEAVKRRLEK
jgi:hypothetical protein